MLASLHETIKGHGYVRTLVMLVYKEQGLLGIAHTQKASDYSIHLLQHNDLQLLYNFTLSWMLFSNFKRYH